MSAAPSRTQMAAAQKLVIATSRLEAFACSHGLRARRTTRQREAERRGLERPATAQHPFLPRTSKVINALFVTERHRHRRGAHRSRSRRRMTIIAGTRARAGHPFARRCEWLIHRRVSDCPSSWACMFSRATKASSRSLKTKGALLWSREDRASVSALLALEDADHLPRGGAVLHPASTTSAPEGAATRSTRCTGCLPWGRNRIYGTVESRVPTGASAASAPGACRCPFSTSRMARVIMAPSRHSTKSPNIDREAGRESVVRERRRLVGQRTSACPPARRVAMTRSTCGSTPVARTSRSWIAIPSCTRPPTCIHRGHRPASRLVPVFADGERRRARRRALQGVITHGFVVDTSGKKIRKSDQSSDKNAKPMTADHYYNEYRRGHGAPLG